MASDLGKGDTELLADKGETVEVHFELIALSEIDARPELVSTSALEALVTRARAELAAADGNSTEAVDLMHAALRQWSAIEAPLMVAQTRCRLAELLRDEGDVPSSTLVPVRATAGLQMGHGSFRERPIRLEDWRS